MKDELDALNLSALEGVDLAGEMTEQELEDNGKEILWLSDEMPPPENIAYSLRRLDAGLSELLEMQARLAESTDRAAMALERIANIAAKVAAQFEG